MSTKLRVEKTVVKRFKERVRSYELSGTKTNDGPWSFCIYHTPYDTYNREIIKGTALKDLTALWALLDVFINTIHDEGEGD